MKPVPDHLEVETLEIICWAEILPAVRYEERCRFYNGSTGQPDPRFHHLAVVTEQVEGFEPSYLVVYFDRQGSWITQSSFETLQGAIDHGRNTFEIKDWQWHWIDTDALRDIEDYF